MESQEDNSSSPEEKVGDVGKEKEKAMILEQIEEMKKSSRWKVSERQSNISIESRPEDTELRRLDSSLKKNTAFVRKVKGFTESQKTSILKDINGLNLTKYIGEVAGAVTEAKLKMSDVQSLLEVCSVLHAKYADFAPSLMENWKKILGHQKGQTTISNPSKLRVDIRVYCDLISIGILGTKEALPILGGLLTTMTNNPEDLSYVGIILTFCRYCGDEFANLIPRKVKLYLEANPDPEFSETSKLLPLEKQKIVQLLLKDYYSNIVKKYHKDFNELKSTEKTNYRILMTKGEVFAERKKKVEEMNVTFKKLQTHVEQLSDLLDEDIPQLQEEEDNTAKGTMDGADDNDLEVDETNPDGLGQLWEDDDTKSFYEILIDLLEIVPAILYKDSKAQVEIQPAKPMESEDIEETSLDEEINEDEIMKDEDIAPPNLEDLEVEDNESGSNMSTKMIFDAFLSKLPNCVNREMIDSAATEFCMQFNTKNNRKKLVKCLYSVHRNRQDLLPFYARMVATLNPCMPDIAVQLGQYLKQEFRWQLRKKDQMKIESKLKVCRFVGELVKFQMFPKSEALFCLKQLLFDFSHHHIEMACTLLDTCGLFMYRSSESHQRCKIYLEQMMRKKVAMTLDQRYIMMIDNAYYAVNPPVTEERSQGRKLTPLASYVEKLIFNDLSSHNTEKVLKQIRRLHWNDPEEAAFIVKTLGDVWNYKFNNIRYGASMIAGLVSYHDWVGVQIVEDTLEHVRIGLEMNDAKYNQRRLAVAKFMGELYNYRLIDSALVFKVLYSLLTFGIDRNEVYNLLDPPEDMMRLRLICTVLDTCGAYFVSGSSKAKLKFFLAYFQQYYWKKREHPFWTGEGSYPFPFEVENNIEVTLNTLRPKVPPHKSQDEADGEVKKLEEEMVKVISGKAPELASLFKNSTSGSGERTGSPQGLGAISEEMEDMDDMDEDHEDYDEDLEDDDEDDSSKRMRNMDDEDEDEDGSDTEEDGLDVSESASVSVKTSKHVKCEEDDDFVNMMDKMMNETLNESKASVPRSQQVEIVAPVHSRQQKKLYADPNFPPSIGASSSVGEDTDDDSSTIQFAVLMRKGQKQTLKELAVPKDSDMAVNLFKQEEVQRQEKEKMKKLTLEINERQEEEDLNEAIAMMQRPGLVNINTSRKPRAVPHKGVPNNVDAIFGNKRAPPSSHH